MQFDEAFADGWCGRQAGEFGQQVTVAAELQARGEQLLGGAQAQFVEVGAQAQAQVVGRGAVQRRAVPLGQRVPEHPFTLGQVGCPRGAVDQAAEPVGVDAVGVGSEEVAALPGHERDAAARVGEHGADAGDLGAQDAVRLLRWVVGPQQGAQPVARYRLAGVQQQDRQQAAFLPAGQCEDPAVVCVYLDRSEHTEPHVAQRIGPGRGVGNAFGHPCALRCSSNGPAAGGRPECAWC